MSEVPFAIEPERRGGPRSRCACVCATRVAMDAEDGKVGAEDCCYLKRRLGAPASAVAAFWQGGTPAGPASGVASSTPCAFLGLTLWAGAGRQRWAQGVDRRAEGGLPARVCRVALRLTVHPAQDKKKASVFFRMKKVRSPNPPLLACSLTAPAQNLSEKAVTSKGGKAMLKKVMDKQTQELIVTLKRIIAVYTGNAQEADDLEQNALKIIMKVRRPASCAAALNL